MSRTRMMKDKFHKRFPKLKYEKVVLFRNPNEFSNMFIERINPNHHGLIWGQRRKKLKKGSAYIKAGEIWFSVVGIAYVLTSVAWIDMATGYLYNLLLQTTVLSLSICFILSVMLYYMPLRLGKVEKKLCCLTHSYTLQ